MKKLVFFAAFALMVTVAFGQATTTAQKADVAVAAFDNQNFDFGKIKQGVPVTHEFTFVNKGKVNS